MLICLTNLDRLIILNTQIFKINIIKILIDCFILITLLQFVLPSSNDGIHFDVYEFTLQPNSQRKLSITWQPSVYGNMRKLIKIEEVDNNRKYDFVILGNCIDPLHKKLRVSQLRDFSVPMVYTPAREGTTVIHASIPISILTVVGALT